MTIGVKISMLEQLKKFLEELAANKTYYQREILELEEKLSEAQAEEDSWTVQYNTSRIDDYNDKLKACEYLTAQFEKMI